MNGTGVITERKVRIPAVFQKAHATKTPIASAIANATNVAEKAPLTNCSATSAESSATKSRCTRRAAFAEAARTSSSISVSASGTAKVTPIAKIRMSPAVLPRATKNETSPSRTSKSGLTRPRHQSAPS